MVGSTKGPIRPDPTPIGLPAGPLEVEAPRSSRRKTPKEAPMSKSPKPRKPAKTARRTATSEKDKGQSRRRGQRARQNALAAVRNGTKQAMLVDLLDSAKGASVSEMAAEAGWQPHSVRGFLSGTVKKKLGLKVISAQVEDRGRVYRIPRKA